MEHIKKALELTRNSLAGGQQGLDSITPASLIRQPGFPAFTPETSEIAVREIALDRDYLESQRIIAFNNADRRTRSFDILRTQVLQTMKAHDWQLLAITSPTPNCGKTLTAVNLGLSIARQQETSVLLIDLDLQKPRVAQYLGIKPEQGLLAVLGQRASLGDAMIDTRLGRQRLRVVPCETPTQNSSEWMASRAMTALIQQVRQYYRSWIVILDLPPILPSDEVLSILPQVDCVLLVTAVGTSTASEIKECSKHLQSASVVRVVLNKTSRVSDAYY